MKKRTVAAYLSFLPALLAIAAVIYGESTLGFNDGTFALPIVIAGEAKGKTKTLYSPETAELLSDYWSRATGQYYREGGKGLSSLIDMAKTGTAEQGNGTVNRLLMGVSREKQTAFMIVVENWQEGDPMPADIANTLMPLLP